MHNGKNQVLNYHELYFYEQNMTVRVLKIQFYKQELILGSQWNPERKNNMVEIHKTQ